MSLTSKVVIAVREGLEPNLAANATAVLGMSLGGRLSESLGADGKDASGGIHSALNMHPVPVVTASAEQLAELHQKAREREDMIVIGFNEVARRARQYDDYLEKLAETPAEDIEFVGVAVYGPRNRVTALTKRFPLL